MATEIWKAITIKEISGKYKISESGRIKRRGYFLKTSGRWNPETFLIPRPHSKKKQYLRINLSKNGYAKSFYIHRLVAIHFVPNPENKPCINHKDANKLNNHYTNLEWCTDAENNKHAREMGLFDGANSKIPLDQRRFIRENFFKLGRTVLAEMFGLNEDYVLAVSGAKVRGTIHSKKHLPRVKEVINIETGEKMTTIELSNRLNTKRKYVLRMLNEERRPNTSPYRYTGKFVAIS